MRAFVQHPPHLRLMAALAPHMDKTKFVRWGGKVRFVSMEVFVAFDLRFLKIGTLSR